jgi:hypothetical protein
LFTCNAPKSWFLVIVSVDHPSGLDFCAKFLKLSVTIQKLPDTQNWTWKYWDVHSNTMYCIISNKVLGVPHCKMTNGTAYGRIGQWCYHWYMTSVERSPFGIDKDRPHESHPIAVNFEDVSDLYQCQMVTFQHLSYTSGNIIVQFVRKPYRSSFYNEGLLRPYLILYSTWYYCERLSIFMSSSVCRVISEWWHLIWGI